MRLLSGNVLQEVASNQASSRASARFSALLSLASEAGEATLQLLIEARSSARLAQGPPFAVLLNSHREN